MLAQAREKERCTLGLDYMGQERPFGAQDKTLEARGESFESYISIPFTFGMIIIR
jgi:hypothetical protein